MRKNIGLNKKGDGSPVWMVVTIILCLIALVFFIYFAIKSGNFAKLLSGKIF